MLPQGLVHRGGGGDSPGVDTPQGLGLVLAELPAVQLPDMGRPGADALQPLSGQGQALLKQLQQASKLSWEKLADQTCRMNDVELF